jgi:hypothetical protein
MSNSDSFTTGATQHFALSALAADPNCYPHVNLNGDQRETLVNDRHLAYLALSEAITRLQEVAPHGRNYQTAPLGSYERARAQYEQRMAVLRTLHKGLADEMNYLQDTARTAARR